MVGLNFRLDDNVLLIHFTSFFSDVPLSLALATLEAIPALTGTEDTGFDFTVYTGDLVSHDPDNQLSRFVS